MTADFASFASAMPRSNALREQTVGDAGNEQAHLLRHLQHQYPKGNIELNESQVPVHQP